MPETPEDLHSLEYARHILEEIGWPAKGNLETVADCLHSISKARRLTPAKAHGYMARAVKLAQQQNIPIDKFWFLNGDYMKVRPVVKDLSQQEQFQPCGKCEGGWVRVERDGFDGMYSALTRCTCFKEWVKKVNNA